jgi:hypothetical protein
MPLREKSSKIVRATFAQKQLQRRQEQFSEQTSGRRRSVLEVGPRADGGGRFADGADVLARNDCFNTDGSVHVAQPKLLRDERGVARPDPRRGAYTFMCFNKKS